MLWSNKTGNEISGYSNVNSMYGCMHSNGTKYNIQFINKCHVSACNTERTSNIHSLTFYDLFFLYILCSCFLCIAFRVSLKSDGNGNSELFLVLMSPLDRELQSSYTLKLIARDSGKPSKSVELLGQTIKDFGLRFCKNTQIVDVSTCFQCCDRGCN